MLKPLLQFRNVDSTADLNNHLAGFFKKGIVSGGDILTVPAQLAVDITPFKLIGEDGMVVLETSATTRLNVTANAINVIVFQSLYVANDAPVLNFQVLELSAYTSSPIIDQLTVFGTVTVPALATQVLSSYIDLSMRDVINPVGRLTLQGVLNNISLLPANNNRPGDGWVVTSGLGDTPAIYAWNGVAYINITDSVLVASLLNAHRNNLFSNEIHLTDLQAAAVAGTYGVPSGTNKFVTDSDPRVPTIAEAQALVGLEGSPGPANPYVTGAFSIAQPTSLAFSANPGSALPVPSGNGPVYVGLGGAGTAAQWFKLYHATLPREFVDSTGAPVTISGVFKDAALLQPLIPSGEPTVLADHGFYSNVVYLALTGNADLPSRLMYGQKQPIQSIDRGLLLREQPKSAETTQETLVRLQSISGREFDDTIPSNEQNTQLRVSVNLLRKYLNGTTASDMVLDSYEYARLRSIPEFAADFPFVPGETVIFAGGTAYTVSSTTAAIQTFDSFYTSNPFDASAVAIINYSAAVVLTGTQPGHIFVDGAGNRYRILAVNTSGNGSLMIYTNGQPVSTVLSAGSGSVLQGNNPRQIELNDHTTAMFRDTIVIDGADPNYNAFENLPPGGSSTGTGALFSLIGTPLLPNQGNPNGAPSGRPISYVTPKKQGNRYDPRVQLVGNWKNDQTNFPRQAVGQVSQGACGIEFTGRITDLTLYTAYRSTMPYNFQVFIDGVYNAAASQFVSSPNLGSLTPSSILLNLRVPEVSPQPLFFPLGLSSTQYHTVRIEILGEGIDNFPLYGMEVFYSAGVSEEAGRTFVETDLVKIDTADQTATPPPNQPVTLKGTRYTRFIDRTSQVRSAFSNTIRTLTDISATVSAGNPTFTSAVLAPTTFIGDVYLFTDRVNPIPSSSNYVFKRVVAVDKTTNNITIESANSFSIPSGRVELAFRIPCRVSDGAPIVSAPPTPDEVEYLRLTPADWDVGSARDISQLSKDAPENRVTVLDDGQTSLLVQQCQLVSTNLEGYATGIRMNTTGSVMVMQGFCTRMDVIFTGNVGPVTLTVEIDGSYSYPITLRGDGLERHSLFMQGSPQSHVVRIMNPSVGNAAVVSAWIFHQVKSLAVTGTVISDFITTRCVTATPHAGFFFDYALLSNTNPLITSFCGVRVLDITKGHARYYNGSGNNFDWRIQTDFTKNPRFGYYAETDRTNAQVDIDGVGSHFEIYYEARPDAGIANLFINDTLATFGNFPTLINNISSGAYTPNTGAVDYYSASNQIQRIVVSNLPFGRYKFTIQNTGTKNGASTGFEINVHAFAENPGSGVVMRRNLDDSSQNRLHFSSFEDLRDFVTLLPEQVGLVQGTGTSTGTGTGIQQLPEVLSGLIDLETEPYLFGTYVDWNMDADPIASPASPVSSAVGFSPPSLYQGNPPSLKLAYDASLTYTAIGQAVSFQSAPSWVTNPSDLVGAIFQPLGASNQSFVYRITAASSLQNVTIESPITTVAIPESCAAKQCLHTKDLVQFKPGTSGNNQSVADRVPVPIPSELTGIVGKDIFSILVDAEASVASGSAGIDPVYGSPLVSYVANIKGVRADGTTPDTADTAYWSIVQTFPKYQEQPLSIFMPPPGTNSERLFLRLFPAQITGAGSINLLRWAALYFEDQTAPFNVPVNLPFFFGYADNSSPAVGGTVFLNGSNKTQITFSQPYNFNAFPNTTNSILAVVVDGKVFPRATAGVTITDGYFTELDSFNIQLDGDYTGTGASLDVRFRQNFSQLNIGTFSPLVWVESGFIAVSGFPFDAPRSIFEPRNFTRLRLSARNTGSSGTTTVNIYKNGILVASGTLAANGTNGTNLNSVLIAAIPEDIITAQISSAAMNCADLSVELA